MTAAALLVDAALAKSYIKGYTKTDGTVVKPHDDTRLKHAPPAKWSAAGKPSTNAPQFSGHSGRGPAQTRQQPQR